MDVGTAVAEQRPILLNDVDADPRYLAVVPGARAQLAVPLRHKGEVGAPTHVAGTRNFWVVTRYNWSSYYALAVIELGAAVERARAWLDPAVTARYPNSGARIADLDQLGRLAAAGSSLRQFLADLTLDPPSSTSDLAGPPHLDDDFVTIDLVAAKDGETVEYVIVGSAEAAPGEGRISNESPVGKALLGHKKGDTVSVSAPKGAIQMKVLAVS